MTRANSLDSWRSCKMGIVNKELNNYCKKRGFHYISENIKDGLVCLTCDAQIEHVKLHEDRGDC